MIQIYYTAGPSSVDISHDMLFAGANGARLTFSFGTPEIQLERARVIHGAAKKLKKEATIIADLEGGGFRLGEINLNGKESFTVTSGETLGVVQSTLVETKVIPIPDVEVYESIADGDTITIGDGSAQFRIEKKKEELVAVSLFAGVVEGRRGLFVQNDFFDPVCLTKKDLSDLEHIANHVEYDKVALSFVSSVADIEQARLILNKKGSTQKIIAKIETRKGVENIEKICESADEIMVARGDLALALPWVEMPHAVDVIVEACQKSNTPFIMATQVAEGMLHGNLLTRAEMTDLWRWKTEGMSGVLLSRETAWGDLPIETVQRVRSLLDFDVI